jgi:hypothetical protein
MARGRRTRRSCIPCSRPAISFSQRSRRDETFKEVILPVTLLPPRDREVHIILSQDQQEIYITVATDNDDYVRYVQRQSRQEAFLYIKNYGPFKVTERTHVNHLAKLILGSTLAEEGR